MYAFYAHGDLLFRILHYILIDPHLSIHIQRDMLKKIISKVVQFYISSTDIAAIDGSGKAKNKTKKLDTISMEKNMNNSRRFSRCWIDFFFIFIPTYPYLGKMNPFCLIFSDWVGSTTNQPTHDFSEFLRDFSIFFLGRLPT